MRSQFPKAGKMATVRIGINLSKEYRITLKNCETEVMFLCILQLCTDGKFFIKMESKYQETRGTCKLTEC